MDTDREREFEAYRKLAREVMKKLEKEIETDGKVTWRRVLELAGRKEAVYKFALKYLRQAGYDIGDHKRPLVKKAESH